MPAVLYLVTVLGAYLMGSIPFGYLVARVKGIDIRAAGSGNIGATNALRVLGTWLGVFVLAADALKGYAACAFLPVVAAHWFGDGAAPDVWLRVAAAVAAVLGHNYTCWLRFRGGKGIATSAGVLSALMPRTLATILATFLIVTLLTRYVSMGSLLAAAVLPFAAWFWERNGVLTGVGAVLGGLAIFRHRGNIRRLRAGTERRLGAPQPPADEEGGA